MLSVFLWWLVWFIDLGHNETEFLEDWFNAVLEKNSLNIVLNGEVIKEVVQR